MHVNANTTNEVQQNYRMSGILSLYITRDQKIIKFKSKLIEML